MTLALWFFMCLVYGYGCQSAGEKLDIPTWISLLIAGIVPFVLAMAFMEAFK